MENSQTSPTIPTASASNGGNYASWKSQMTNLLFGYGLLGFVNGTRPCPFFANHSNTRMLSIMSSLMSNKKEGKTVAAYMSKVKILVDDLALIGYPLNDAQIMSYTLNGLGNEFKELTVAVRVRDTPISF
ncbi:hypothetical protein ACOSP7_031355 [Xanthoceras sorbifolium]